MILILNMIIIRKWDSSKNRAKYTPTLTFFNFGIVCAIARYMPRKLFLYQLLRMKMISNIKDLLRMIMRMIVIITCKHAICQVYTPYATATPPVPRYIDRKSTRLNSSHGYISYAVFFLK